MEPTPVAPDISARTGYASTLALLNRQSVLKHSDAYGDIDWDTPEYRIDPQDPVFELTPNEWLGATAWYRALPPATRARLGLELVCHFMKVGAQFENVLVRGLLEFAQRFPDGSPERRYAMHESIEECQHIQMFREFVARSTLDVPGLSGNLRALGKQVISFARTRPALFFIFVMGGEDPIDYVQRRTLHDGRPIHPLLKRIMQIHVTEEARHLCFARMFVEQEAQSWSSARRHTFGLISAPILGLMTRLMLHPGEAFVQRYGIPDAVMQEAYGGAQFAEEKRQSVRKIRGLFEDAGLYTRDVAFAWRKQGLA